MLRLKQRLLLMVACFIACLLVYALYVRQGGDGKTDKTDGIGYPASEAKSPQLQVSLRHKSSAEEKHQVESKNDNLPAYVLRTVPYEQVKNNCKIYLELRDVDFLQPSLQDTLCSGVKAYVKGQDGYPMCKLPVPFDERVLGIVRAESATTDLLDMKNAKVTMFIYTEKDFISETIRRTHHWEPQLVYPTLRFAQRVPNVTFLDAGCNIGVYSVLAARLGLRVVSLDANIRNLLRLRLTLSAAALDASLVWNFIGSGGDLSFLNFPEDCNVGGATKFGRAVKDTIPVMPVRSDALCSLISTNNVVIKLDVEGGEADFLRTSGRLFSEFTVAAVQMEWLQRHMVGNDSSTILNFFTSRRYSAWRTPGLTQLEANGKGSSRWGDGDVLWVHKDFEHLLPQVRKGAGSL